MGEAMMAGVSGLKAHQKMLDVAGNNLANVNTNGFKSSRVTFSELLSDTIRQATQPVGGVGGTNPMQIGGGTQVASVDKKMTQGSLVDTGQPLDMAIDGAGFFILSDGRSRSYTRVGSFTVDSNFNLVDPGTGFRVQRQGSLGVADGFQDPANSDIRIPYDVALPARQTQNITFTGNLTADNISPSTNILSSGLAYTSGGSIAAATARIADLDQVSGLVAGDRIDITGTDREGNAVSSQLVLDATTTLEDLITAIDAVFPGSTTTMNNGELRLSDDQSGYSQTDLRLTYVGAGSMELPDNFNIISAGGLANKTTSVEIFDSQGVSHILSGVFVRTDQVNTWDFVVTSVSGGAEMVDRRVRGITFQTNGAFGGLDTAQGDTMSFEVRFAHDPDSTRLVNLNFGNVGQFDGLTQFGGASTASSSEQDGYASGWLSSMSVSREGILVGMFSNGVKREIASLALATFQNPAGLEAIGNNYYAATSNSGRPIETTGLAGGAGAVRGGVIEKSNVEIAVEFVNLMQAQNGFQANSRTIRVADEMLREIANLIR